MATRNVTTVFAVQGENEYRKAVQNINREIKEANSELKLLAEQYRGQEDSSAALQDKLKALTDLYGKQAEKVGKIEEALGNAQDAAEKYANKGAELRDKLQRNAEEMAKLAEAGQKASDAYKNLQEEDGKLEKALADNDAKYDAAQRGVSDWRIKLNDAKSELLKTKTAMQETSGMLSGTLVPEFEESEDKIRNTGDAFGDFRSKAEENMDAVASIVAAAGIDQAFEKVWDAMQACIDKSMEFESAMTGVFKTVDMTLEEETQLAADIRQMAEEIPVSTTEIAGVAELAGQLGISNEALLGFVETMVMLGTATNLSAEEAAEALAKFANIAGTEESDYGRLGSVLVGLGNNFATTEADIMNMTTRLASTGSVLGLTEAEMFAIATALSSVGIEAEAGGSAISKLMKDIETAVVGYDALAEAEERTGLSLEKLISTSKGLENNDLKNVALAAGYGTTELRNIIEAGELLENLSEVSGKTSEEFIRAWGENSVSALEDFLGGLKDIDENGGSAVQTLENLGFTEVRMSNAILALSQSDGLLSETLRIANEAWDQNIALTDEAAKRFETTESKVQILKNSMDNLLIAVGDDYLTTLEPVIEKLTELTQTLSDDAADSPALASTLAGIGGALGGLAGLTTVATGIKLVSGALSAFGSAGGIAAVGVSALTGIAAGVTTYVTNATAVSEAAQEVIDKNDNLVEAYKKSKEAYEQEMGAVDLNRQEIEKLIEKVVALSDEAEKTPADEAIIQGVVDRLNKLLPGLGLTYDGVTQKINLTRESMQRFAEEAEKTAKLEAFEQYLGKLSGQQAALEVQQDITNQKISEAQEKLDEAARAVEEYSEGTSLLQKILDYTNPSFVDLKLAEEQAKNELEKLTESQTGIQDALKNTETELAATQEAFDLYVEKLGQTAETAHEAGKATAEGYADGMTENSDAVEESAVELMDTASGALQNNDARGAGQDFAGGFAEGIEDGKSGAEAAGAELARAAERAMKAEAAIASPSKKAFALGRFWGEGFAGGIAGSEADVDAAVHRLSTQLDIAPEVADRVRAAQAEIGKLSFGEGFAVDAAAQYRNSMAQIGRMAAQASSGAANGQPMEITNVIQLDGRVIAQSVSRTQYNQNRTVLRTNGIKK
ncbi:MAG: phage tail tape measure protein [Ruminococcaceae bacterium]|nr:phage tail tape measure protein [Oscillospiraceae bacterium]